MDINLSTRIRKFFLGFALAGIVLLSIGSSSPIVHAQKAERPPQGKYYSVDTSSLADGTLIKKHIINGPSVPPSGFEAERQPVVPPDSSMMAANGLAGVGGSTWVLGCSATAAGDIIAIYDQEKYPNLYNGLTNNGRLPIGNNPWPTDIDCLGGTLANNPVIASKKGLDGRTTFGTFDDYYISYESALPDPYLGYGGGCAVPAARPVGSALDASTSTGWQQHVWGDSVGDYMYTSQSAFGNVDGATQFYTYANSALPFTCDEMSRNSLPDGALGIKQFYQARGYAVGACYNQPTDNVIAGGFSFAQFKAEIDAGRPVMLNLEGHTVVGINYNASSNLVYIHDGWDYETHAMTWGEDYVGMALQSVSIVNIIPGTPNYYTISGNSGVANATITYTGGFTTADGNGNYSFTVSESWFGTVTPSSAGYNFTPPSRSFKNVRENHTAQDYIATDSDFPRPFAKSSPSNGINSQPNILMLSWETSIGASFYDYCYDTTNDNTCTNWISNGSSTSKALSGLSASTTYYWHVRAINSSGTTFSDGGETAFWSFTTAPITPVQGIEAWTADGSWNPKTSFIPGDSIQWAIDVQNTTTTDKQVTLVFLVKDPAGSVVSNGQGTVTTQPGIWSWAISDTTSNTEGIYTFIGSVIYQGIKTTKSTTYTVALPCYTLSKSVTAGGNGTINSNPPPNCNNETQYRQGTVVQLTASPYGGYGFDGWSGDITSSLNPISITMTGDKSITASFSLLPPATPQLISPHNGAVLDIYSPTLDWKDLAFTPDHYQLQFATSNDFISGVLYDQNLNESMFNIPAQLISGNTYYWHVRAFNSLGQVGDWSETWTISVKLLPVNLLAPVANTHLLTLRPTFDWSDVSNVGYYTIQVSKNSSFTPIVMSETSPVSIFTSSKDLPSAQTFYWRVRSEGAGGTSKWSQVLSFTTPNPPSVPILASPHPGVTTTDYRPLFKWSQVLVPRDTQFDHYQIQVSTNQTFSASVINENISGLSTITMYSPAVNLAHSTKYYWHMRAFNTNNEASSWSETRSFTTPAPHMNGSRPGIYSLDPTLPIPTIVSPLNSSISALQPKLDWEDITGATSYIVQLSTDSNFADSTFIASATTVDSKYEFVRDVPSGTVLYWRVLTISKGSISDWSPVSTFSVP